MTGVMLTDSIEAKMIKADHARTMDTFQKRTMRAVKIYNYVIP